MKFTKMHGLGNDFILVDGFSEKIPSDINNVALKLCHRHFGLGADGLIIALPSTKADIRMKTINSDGSEAEMCGNGLRCFAKFVYERQLISQKKFSVETLAGIMGPRLIIEQNKVTGVTVDMGEPSFARSSVPILGEGGQALNEPLKVLNQTFYITAMLMGVPHTVVFVDDLANFPVEKYGPALEDHPIFPRKTNADFAQVLSRNEINYRVWERAAGLTMACGTGACAVLVASVLNNKTERQAKVHLPGGSLEISWAENNHVYMTGPAVTVYSGQVLEESLLS
ncbi:MAG: diaminopimelate epimerase [Peptococcia bacterium]